MIAGAGRDRVRVLIVGIGYLPKPTGIGPCTAGLTEQLAARGDEVTVLTGLPYLPGWRLMRDTPRRLLATEGLGGVTVLRAARSIPATPSGRCGSCAHHQTESWRSGWPPAHAR